MKESVNNRLSFGLKEHWAVSVEIGKEQVLRISDQSIVCQDDLDPHRNKIEICALRLLSKVARKESDIDEMAVFEDLAKESMLRPDERAEALRWFLHGRLSIAPAKELAVI